MIHRTPAVGFASLCALAVALISPSASAEPWDKPGWNVTFHDEFDKGVVDPASWVKRYKWGEAVINSELQAYVDDAFAFQGDVLRIVGEHKTGSYAGQTMEYTSGVISSVHEQKYGYFEIACQMPKGKGLWPAFWLLGKVGATGVNEIDIHEFLGHETDKVYMTIHWGPSYDQGHKSDSTDFVGPDFTAGMHKFAVEWEADHVTWYVDDIERFTHAGEGVPQVEMYVIANLAIGGGWPGSPDSTTPFPSYYDVDYIRVYERAAPDAGAQDAGAQDAAATDGTATQDVVTTDGKTDGPTEAQTDARDATSEATADGSGGAGPGAAPGAGSDDGGCGCRTAGRNSTNGWLLALSCLALLRGRRNARGPRRYL